MKTVTLSTSSTAVESVYARSHDCAVVAVNGSVDVLIDGFDEPITLECDISVVDNRVDQYDIYCEDEGIDVKCELAYAQDILDRLLADGDAEVHFY